MWTLTTQGPECGKQYGEKLQHHESQRWGCCPTSDNLYNESLPFFRVPVKCASWGWNGEGRLWNVSSLPSQIATSLNKVQFCDFRNSFIVKRKVVVSEVFLTLLGKPGLDSWLLFLIHYWVMWQRLAFSVGVIVKVAVLWLDAGTGLQPYVSFYSLLSRIPQSHRFNGVLTGTSGFGIFNAKWVWRNAKHRVKFYTSSSHLSGFFSP